MDLAKPGDLKKIPDRVLKMCVDQGLGIEEFKERYVEGHEQDQKNFPLKMTEGDWNEQELAFRNFKVL